MESGSAELLQVINTDHALCRACAEVLHETMLSQQLETLREVMDKTMSAVEEEGGMAGQEEGVAGEEEGVAKEEGGLAGGEEGVAKEEGGLAGGEEGVAKEEGGMAREEEGMAGEEGAGHEEEGVVKEEVDGGDVMEEQTPQDVQERGSNVDDDSSAQTHAVEHLTTHSVAEEVCPEALPDGRTSYTGHSDMITANVDFPSGPAYLGVGLGAGLEEGDLDTTLIGEDAPLTFAPEEEDELTSSSSHVEVQPEQDNAPSSNEVGVAPSESKTIPLNNHAHKGRSPDSTPSSSLGGSIGRGVWSVGPASVDSSTGGDLLTPASVDIVDTSTTRVIPNASRRQSLEGRAKDEDDDVIAVPLVMRSSSTG